MKSKFKRALAVTASLAICGMTLLQFPSGTFYLPLPASAAEGDACTETACTGTFDANGFCTEGGTHYEPAADSDGVYEIANAGQLYWFMELVNNGEYAVDIDAILTADITVNENVLNEDGTLAEGDFLEWFPISYYHDRDGDGSEEEVYYIGTFDGRGHTISGLYFDNAEQNHVGLFGQTESGAEICNVTVADSYFNGSDFVGGVCGCNSYGAITNSTNSGSVTGTDNVGGVCGMNNSGTITNSTNSGSVTGEYYVGGVCGSNYGTITNSTNSGSVAGESSVGGVCGFNNDIITNCYYDSNVFTGNAVGTDFGTSTDVLGKTTEEFKTGEVAYLLQSAQTETDEEGNILHVWGQELGVQDYPVLNGKTVYYHYTDCYRKQKNYTNDSKEATGHDFVNGTCVYCGNTPSCVHPEYENGFCLACDTYEPAADTDGDGVYEIANAGQLYWFMELVNNYGEYDVDIDAILTADITVNENVLKADGTLAEGDFRAWFPIGYYYDRDGDSSEESICYNGTFDGQNHTISGLYFDNAEQDHVGLFGQTESGAEICNVTVADSYFKGKNAVGGVCGYNSGTITNSTNSGSVEGGADFVGGVCGYNDSGTITNSTNSGSVTGEYYVGGVCGFNYGTITNSTNSGSVAGEYSIGGVCSYNSDGTVTNCYYDSDVFTGDAVGSDSGTTTDVLGKTTEEFKSGEVAYLLQSAQTETDENGDVLHVWGQTIGEDTYPVLGGDKVYQCESECSGIFYSNTEGDVQAHAYVNGFCTNTDCEDGYQPATDTDEDGVYEIANAGQLYWFMEYVNAGNTETDAILTADITVNENVLNEDGTLAEGDFRAWFPIGYYYDRDDDSNKEDIYYNGTFDGQGYTISGLYFDNTAQSFVGLFGQIYSGAEICNVTVADSYFKGCNDVGGVCGYNYKGTITNCVNSGSVTGEYYVGGVCGYNYGTITNSTNSGSVTGNIYVGGVCGNNNYGTIANCYYDSNVFTGDAVGYEDGTSTDVLGKPTEEFKSGEVAYLLQSAQTETDENGNILHVWGQTLGEDNYPVLGGDEVYQCESECGGTFYSNNENDTKEHLYDDNGFCTNCEDGYQPATDTDENGVYEIANAGQLYWFMEYVNANTLLSGGDTEDTSDDVYTSSSDAILTQNITVNENVLKADGTLNGDGSNFREWFPIGYYYDRDDDGNKENIYYNGTFDGQGYTISGLYFDNAEQSYVGLFGQIDSGAEICNVTVADSYFKGSNYVGGVCGYNYGTITDCTNSGSVTGTNRVGGVCGYNSRGTIKNSTNSGSVMAVVMSAACAATMLKAQLPTAQTVAVWKVRSMSAACAATMIPVQLPTAQTVAV